MFERRKAEIRPLVGQEAGCKPDDRLAQAKQVSCRLRRRCSPKSSAWG
jgi:hypothetical protein